MNNLLKCRLRIADCGIKTNSAFIPHFTIRNPKYQRRSKLAVLVVLALLSSWLQPPVSMAGGLTSAFAKVKVEHLQPGKTYRASKFYQPIVVINSSDDPIQLTMEVIRPRPEDLDPGFEAIPDVTWAVLDKDRFDLEPWSEASADLAVTVPLDKAHLGKQYQIQVWSKAASAGNVSVGLMHKLLITVANEIDPAKGKEPTEVYRFTLEPFEYFAKNVKFNRPIDLFEQSGTALVLKNPNKKKCRYRVESLPYSFAPIVNLKGYEPAPQKQWLSVGDHEFEVEAKSERRIPLTITLPRNPNYRKKNYLFLVRVTSLDGDSPFSMISRVYITTSERLLD